MKKRLSVLLLSLMAFALFADDFIFHDVDANGFEYLNGYACTGGKMEEVPKMRNGVKGNKLIAT